MPDPSIAPWVHDFIEQFASFPNGVHDDDVDAATHALFYLSKYVTDEPVPTERDHLAEKYGRDSQAYRIYSQMIEDEEDPNRTLSLEEMGL